MHHWRLTRPVCALLDRTARLHQCRGSRVQRQAEPDRILQSDYPGFSAELTAGGLLHEPGKPGGKGD